MISNRKNMSKKEITLVIVGASIVLLISAFICFKSIKSKEEYVMHYSDSSELDYNVYLKDNDFYTTSYLPKDRAYISTLIDYIDASFNYDFNVTEDINLGYKYYISAKLVVDGSSGKRIYENEDILLDKTKIKKVQDKKFSILENVKIDYNKYNQLASSFMNKYDISAKANVIVSMYVDVAGTYEEFQKELNDSAVVSFEIPLTVNTTEIKMNYDLKNNVNEKFEYGKTSIIHPVLFVISLIVAIVDIIFLVWELIVYTVNKDDKVKYQEKLKKIFRDYGPYISKKAMTANTKEIMYTVSLRIEVVDSFDDLINVRDSIEKPILFYEAIPGEQSVFYIIDTKVSYIYIMNAKDCGKKSSKVADLDFAVVEDNKKLNNGDNLIGVEYKNIEKDYLEGIDVLEEKGENDLKKEEIIKKEENQEKNSESVLNEETMLEMTDDLCVPKKKKKKRKKKKQVSE